ncbi:MAG: helix-turn-helix domain-containing protein [Clostridium sp.]|nr:helix-turn-helix domain-containing protein [Clostridium sp.]
MNNLENVNDLITVPEMAKLLKISRSKAYSLIKQVDFPIIRIGKCIRVSRNSLEQWLNI